MHECAGRDCGQSGTLAAAVGEDETGGSQREGDMSLISAALVPSRVHGP